LKSHLRQPCIIIIIIIAIETAGSCNQHDIDIIEDIGRYISVITEELPLETLHLFQLLSVATQRSNAVSLMSTFGDD